MDYEMELLTEINFITHTPPKENKTKFKKLHQIMSDEATEGKT